MKKYVVSVLTLFALILIFFIWMDDPIQKSDPPKIAPLESLAVTDTADIQHRNSSSVLEENDIYRKHLGIAPNADLTDAHRQLIKDLTISYNSVPRISPSEIQKAIETQAEIAKEPSEKIAVEIMFAIQRAFMGGNQRENYPLLGIIEQYGKKATPWLLDRLEWQGVGGEFGKEVFDIILKIEGKETFRHLVNERIAGNPDRYEKWEKY